MQHHDCGAGLPQLASGLLSPTAHEQPPSSALFGGGAGMYPEGSGLSHQLAASRQMQLPSLNTLTAAVGHVREQPLLQPTSRSHFSLSSPCFSSPWTVCLP